MALTLNGRRTGRAGAQELAEQRAEIYAGQEKQADCLEDKFFVLRMRCSGWTRKGGVGGMTSMCRTGWGGTTRDRRLR